MEYELGLLTQEYLVVSAVGNVIKLCYAPRWTTLYHFTVAALRVQMNVATFLQSQIITGVHLHVSDATGEQNCAKDASESFYYF